MYSAEDRLLINNATGEFIEIKKGDYFKHIPASALSHVRNREINKKRTEENFTNCGLDKFNPGMFTKIFTSEFEANMPNMTTNEIALMMLLSEYMEVGSNILMKKNHKNKIRMDDIIHISKMSRSIAYKAMQGLIDKILIIKCTDTDGKEQFVMNPYIMLKGGWLNKTIRRLFDGYVRKSI